jgi:hypothetical protein
VRLKYLEAGKGYEQLLKALTAYIHTENFEAREQEAGKIDLDVLDYRKKQS